MNCIEANKKISLLVDGLLNEKDKLNLLEHINDCNDCKKLYDDMKAMVSDLSDLPEVPLPEGIENRIHFALKREAEAPKKKRWIKFTMIAAPATMALVAIVFGISYLFSGGMKSEDSAAPEMAIMEKAVEAEEVLFEAKEETTANEMESLTGTQDMLKEEATEESTMMDTESGEDGVRGMSSKVIVYVNADNEDELTEFSENVISKLEADTAYEVMFDEDINGAVTFLPESEYEKFMSLLVLVSYEDEIIYESLRDEAAIYEEDLLFEVNFLFQQND